MKSPIKNKGSAIFLHVSKNYEKTKGCVALKKRSINFVKLINNKTKLKYFKIFPQKFRTNPYKISTTRNGI